MTTFLRSTRLRLTINVATKLNRSHLVPGEVSYILPCLSRIEFHRTALGDQAVSMEGSTGCMHGSKGVIEPASDKARPEQYIVAGIAKSTLAERSTVDWDAWRENYSLVREEIATTYPDIFPDFNQRMWEPGGFHRPIPARHRQWQTDTGKANFIVPHSLGEDPDMPQGNAEGLRLMTLRSDSQFNTTIYSLEDRFRGVKGGRMVILMNRADIEKRHLKEGQKVTLQTVADDGIDRRLEGLEIKAYEIPEGCIGGYYPECNILLPLWHYAKESKVPGAKSIPVRIL